MPRVMIADDSLFQRMVLKNIATGAGWDAVEALDGRDCVDKLEDGSGFDLIVLDMTMPRLGGIEVLEELQKSGIDLPVVVLTADIQKSTTARCVELGAKAVLLKPVENDSFLEVLARYNGVG